MFIRVLSFLDEMAKDQVLLFGDSYSFSLDTAANLLMYLL